MGKNGGSGKNVWNEGERDRWGWKEGGMGKNGGSGKNVWNEGEREIDGDGRREGWGRMECQGRMCGMRGRER